MSEVSDEVLMAYADGELPAEECHALERLLRHDPVLRARIEPFIQTREQIASAFEHALHEPVPHRLVAAIQRARPSALAGVSGHPLETKFRDIINSAKAILLPEGFGFTPALTASMAALVVLGAAAGWMAGRASGEPSLIAAAGPDLVAAGTLAHALETNPSGTAAIADGDDGTSVVPVLSFKTASSTVCREYRVRSAEPDRDFAGLACRSADGIWRIAQHVETAKQPAAVPGTAYQTATGADVPAIDAMAATMIAGEALGTEDETRLLENGWRIRR